MRRSSLLLLLAFCLPVPTQAQSTGRHPAAAGHPPGPPGPAGGTIELAVDASEAPRKLLHSRMTIPASPGPLTLVYPKWLPGEHGPTGPITDVVGLQFTAGGKPITWRRDPVDMYAFHVDVPQGAQAVEVALDFLSAATADGFSSAASATPHLILLTWNQLVLYPQGPQGPQGSRSDDVTVHPSLRLPAGWKFGTSLAPAGGSASPERIDFAPVSLTTLVDSPVLAGEYFKAVPLDSSGGDVQLIIAADSTAALGITPEQTETLRRLVQQADALFGARHYDRYRFLLTLSDNVAHFGLEHHQSNDTRMPERALLDDTLGRLGLWVLSHEYVHSWNGKYRRPAGLATANFQEPMQGELLWVYEGLTEYLGNLLAARSGLWTPEQYEDRLANVAADLDHRPGRVWRPLLDTTVAAQLLYASPSEWAAYRRGVDFYDEGELIWLDADTLIREQSQGRRSLDDFCRAFHGGASSSPMVKPYTLDDVVKTLNDVLPYDWRAFLNARVNTIGEHAPLGGIERGGWRLVYNDTRNAHLKDEEEGTDKLTEAGYSIGIRVKDDGELQDVLPGTPAYQAGVAPGMKLIAVNSRRFTPAVLRDALLPTSAAPATVTLLVENQDFFTPYSFTYQGGLREPHLERDESKPDLLGAIIAPRPVAAVKP